MVRESKRNPPIGILTTKPLTEPENESKALRTNRPLINWQQSWNGKQSRSRSESSTNTKSIARGY